jgi:hypothetical protein
MARRRRARENPLSVGAEVALGILGIGAIVGGAYYLVTKNQSSSASSGNATTAAQAQADNIAAGNTASAGTAGS